MSALVRWDDSTRTYYEFDEAGAQSLSRPYNTTENAQADARAVEAQRATARANLTDEQQLAARLARLSAYKTDPEITAALARTNSTTIPTADLNRLLKVMLRRDERQSAAIALAVRLLNPALLADTSDTTDT